MTTDLNQLTPEQEKQASAEVLQRVVIDQFFRKCASVGIVPADEKQAEEMLNGAFTVQQLIEDPQVKQAFAVDDPISRANANLQKVATSLLGNNNPANDDAEHLKTAMAYAQASPEVYAAGLLSGIHRNN